MMQLLTKQNIDETQKLKFMIERRLTSAFFDVKSE